MLRQPGGAALLRAYAATLAADAAATALPRCAALVHASRVVLPRDERLLAPLPLLIDTVLRCVYACPAESGAQRAAAAAAAVAASGGTAAEPLGAEEALEMINVMYVALPTREAALAPTDEVDDAAATGATTGAT
mgnify:CR=1 FL=1